MEHPSSRRLAGLMACALSLVASRVRAEPVPGVDPASPPLRVAPAAPSQQYVRCGTLGPEQVKQAVWSPGRHLLALRMDSGTVRLVAQEGMREIARLAAPLGAIEAIAFSPNGDTLATLAAEMGQVALWRSSDGSLLSTFVGPPTALINHGTSSIAFSPDGSRIATSLGAIIDLTSGTVRTFTGASSNVSLVVNPQNFARGSSVPTLQFVNRGRQLLEIRDSGVGHSPETQRIALTGMTSFESRTIYEGWRDFIDGFAVSPDEQSFAIAGHAGASFPGMVMNRGGLGVYRVEGGVPVAQAQAFSGKLLGFAPSGMTLYALAGGDLVSLDVGNLAVISRVPVPSGARILGIAHHGVGEILTTDGVSTVWRDPVSLNVQATLDYVLESITWTGSYSSSFVGVDRDSTVHLFSERKELGRFSVPAAEPPSLESLGGKSTADGALMVKRDFLLHAASTDWYREQILDTTSGTAARFFAPYVSDVVVAPDGAKAYTKEGSSNAIAVWCR